MLACRQQECLSWGTPMSYPQLQRKVEEKVEIPIERDLTLESPSLPTGLSLAEGRRMLQMHSSSPQYVGGFPLAPVPLLSPGEGKLCCVVLCKVPLSSFLQVLLLGRGRLPLAPLGQAALQQAFSPTSQVPALILLSQPAPAVSRWLAGCSCKLSCRAKFLPRR